MEITQNPNQKNASIGYSLLGLGVFVIFVAFGLAVGVFSGKNKVPAVFNFKAVSMDVKSLMPDANALIAQANPELAKKILQPNTNVLPSGANELQEILPADLINDTSNVAIYIVFLGLLINIGYKLAQIGVSMLKPTQVVLSEKLIEQLKNKN